MNKTFLDYDDATDFEYQENEDRKHVIMDYGMMLIIHVVPFILFFTLFTRG